MTALTLRASQALLTSPLVVLGRLASAVTVFMDVLAEAQQQATEAPRKFPIGEWCNGARDRTAARYLRALPLWKSAHASAAANSAKAAEIPATTIATSVGMACPLSLNRMEL
jgi:hypothetical protein